MKHKIGDKVKIREDLVVNKCYGIDTFVEDMEKFKGKEVTIFDITYEAGREYRIEEDEGAYFWTAEMFETDKVKETIPNPDSRRDDPVNHPSHYTTGKIEVCDFIVDKGLNFCLGNAIKYIARCQHKYGGTKRVEDLKKAKWYIERQIEEWENV